MDINSREFGAEIAKKLPPVKRYSNKASAKAYYERNKAKIKVKALEYARQIKYGLSPEAFAGLLEKQDGECAICKQPLKTGRNIAVDHCHITGTVRGILCRFCNLGIGHFDDDSVRIRAAVAYLEGGYC